MIEIVVYKFLECPTNSQPPKSINEQSDNQQQKNQQSEYQIVSQPAKARKEPSFYSSLSSPVNEKLGNTIPNLPLQVYSRRKADPGPRLVQFSDPIADNEEVCSDSTDLELPIAVQKGTRKCTQHPIAKFISFENCSPSYRSFLTKIHSDKIPPNVEEALI